MMIGISRLMPGDMGGREILGGGRGTGGWEGGGELVFVWREVIVRVGACGKKGRSFCE